MDLVKICKLYMVLMGDGKCNIKQADSLKEISEVEDNPNAFIAKGNEIHEERGNFDIILTNPPFGTKIKVTHESVLRNFELAEKAKKNPDGSKGVPPQILFIELCCRLLKSGGRMAIVMPEGVLGNTTLDFVRSYLFENFIVKAVIDCPSSTFMPYTGTKTCVLVLEKKKNQIPKKHRVFFAIAEESGHTFRGEEIYDEGGKIKEDFSEIADNYLEFKEKGHLELKKKKHLGFDVPFETIIKNDILVPRYYDPRIEAEIKKLKKDTSVDLISLQELCDNSAVEVSNISKAPKAKNTSPQGKIRYVRTADIGNYEIRKLTKQYVDEGVYKAFKEAQSLKENDILFVKDGDHKIGNIAMVRKEERFLVHGHFYKIRAKSISPYLLFYALRYEIVKKQIRQRVFIQSTLGTIGSRIYDLLLPFPKDEKKTEEIIEETKKVLGVREESLLWLD